MFLETNTGKALTDYASKVQPGLSTKAVKLHPDDSNALTAFIDTVREAKTTKDLKGVPESAFSDAERIFVRLGISLDQSITELAKRAEEILTGKIDASVLYRTGRDFK
jgi:hypothetical protein